MKKKIIALFSLLLGYALAENTANPEIRRENLGKGLRIAHISDLHKKRFGKGNRILCDMVRKENPDLVIISGDIVTRDQLDFSAVKTAVCELCRIAPVYMIFGNHEQSLPAFKQEELLEIISRSEVKLLRNSSESVKINERCVNIIGLEPSYSTYKKNGGYKNLDVITAEDMENLLGKCPDGENLLIAHNPLFAEAYAEWGADFTFSGHVHGGSVRLFGKAMLSPERKLFPKYAKGVYSIGKMKLLVSAGLGKLRLFNPPEIVIYEL